MKKLLKAAACAAATLIGCANEVLKRCGELVAAARSAIASADLADGANPKWSY